MNACGYHRHHHAYGVHAEMDAGIGVGLRYFDLKLELEKTSLNGEFDFVYWGPTVFGAFSFSALLRRCR